MTDGGERCKLMNEGRGFRCEGEEVEQGRGNRDEKQLRILCVGKIRDFGVMSKMLEERW